MNPLFSQWTRHMSGDSYASQSKRWWRRWCCLEATFIGTASLPTQITKEKLSDSEMYSLYVRILILSTETGKMISKNGEVMFERENSTKMYLKWILWGTLSTSQTIWILRPFYTSSSFVHVRISLSQFWKSNPEVQNTSKLKHVYHLIWDDVSSLPKHCNSRTKSQQGRRSQKQSMLWSSFLDTFVWFIGVFFKDRKNYDTWVLITWIDWLF